MRYSRAKKRIKNGKYYQTTTLYRQIPERDTDVYVITQPGDRLDTIAFDFYGDPHLWWIIAKANKLQQLNIKVGTSLRIPITTEDATIR
jgi:nucleoid-associated protein YgaU